MFKYRCSMVYKRWWLGQRVTTSFTSRCSLLIKTQLGRMAHARCLEYLWYYGGILDESMAQPVSIHARAAMRQVSTLR